MRAVDRMDFDRVRFSPDYRLPMTAIRRHESGLVVIRSINASEHERIQRKRRQRVRVALEVGAAALVLMLAWFGVLVPLAGWLVGA